MNYIVHPRNKFSSWIDWKTDATDRGKEVEVENQCD